MRGVKAEGGWGVVCTEEVEIHHSSDLAPCFEGRLWDDDDIPALALMAEAVHRHGALAGIELTHNGHDAPNYYSRTAPLGPRTIGLMGGTGYEPGQARRMDREDIRNLRRWHRAGRVEDIRECIGCNICVTGDVKGFPIRCTQNPTMGEEWRRGWHPETIAPLRRDAEILVVGAGPAGLECARALGQRGYSVALVEQQREPGGRAARESRLPGLSEWRRVIDWRLTQIARLTNVTLYPGSPMNAADVLEAGYEHVVVATGADWRRDGVGRTLHRPIPGHDRAGVFTPDDLMADRLPAGRVVVYDDDHYYMGGVLAELLARRGCAVVLMTPAPMIAYWSQFTLEQERIQRRLIELGVELQSRALRKRCGTPGAVRPLGRPREDPRSRSRQCQMVFRSSATRSVSPAGRGFLSGLAEP